MAEPSSGVEGVRCVGVRGLRLVEAPAPRVARGLRAEMDRVWEAEVRARPGAFFDGPVVVCTGLELQGPGCWELAWAPVTYRYFALRQVAGAEVLPSVFVAVVQPTPEGAVLVGRTSSLTARPGRWQPPGGSVEPPAEGRRLDRAALARHAACELAEETGTDVPPELMDLWGITRGEQGNVGVFFTAPPRPEDALRERFAALLSATAGTPEFEELAFVRSEEDLIRLGGRQADYLTAIVRRFTTEHRRTTS